MLRTRHFVPAEDYAIIPQRLTDFVASLEPWSQHQPVNINPLRSHKISEISNAKGGEKKESEPPEARDYPTFHESLPAPL